MCYFMTRVQLKTNFVFLFLCLLQATMDRKRMAGLTIQETAEVHHYDMAA